MSGSANVQAITVIREFRASVLRFQSDVQSTLTAVGQMLQRATQWIENERPQYWKNEVRRGFERVAETRGRLDACKRRRTGDFRPSCFEEQEAFRNAKRQLEIAHQKVERMRGWGHQIRHEIDEFKGRSMQLEACLTVDIPKLLSLLERLSQSLEAYAEMLPPEEASGPAPRVPSGPAPRVPSGPAPRVPSRPALRKEMNDGENC